MKFRSVVFKILAVLMIGLFGTSGCGSPAADTGLTEEPNRGPGVPPGGPSGGKAFGKDSLKPVDKKSGKAETKAGGAAAEKPAGGK